MSLNSKVIFSFVAGALAALLAWIIVDFNGFYRISPSGGMSTYIEMVKAQSFVGAVFGLCVGAAMGLVNGISSGSGVRLKREIAWGAIVGLAGGLLGLMIGQWFFGSFYSGAKDLASIRVIGPVAFLLMVLIRGIGWGLIGLFLGLVQGIPSKSKKAAKHGAIGGFIGGLLGGMLFEVVPNIIPYTGGDPSVLSRGISMTVTGASIGLFIGLVQNIMKQAWVRVLKARNEGKDFIISKPIVTIGRDELADIPLFGDINISKLHATITMENGRYVINDAGSQIGVLVNGQRISQRQVLNDGDIIKIGSVNIEFHEKAGKHVAAPRKDAVQDKPSHAVSNESLCPFCGELKDPVTGRCACSTVNLKWEQTAGSSSQPTQFDSGTAQVGAISPTAAGPRLVSISGVYANRSFLLNLAGQTNIGRGPEKTIDLSLDNTVSRNHAHIVYEDGEYVLYDDGSTNGTFVNGVKISRQVIKPGDRVQFGASQFRFEV